MPPFCNNPVCLIACHTWREIRRQKIFYGFITFALLLAAAGFLLGSLSLNEYRRLSINFSLAACHLSSVLIALYFGSGLLVSDLHSTLVILFTKPVSRLQFMLARFLGLMAVLCMWLFFMFLILCLFYQVYAMPLHAALYAVFLGILLESMVLISLAFLFSLIMSPFLTLVHTFFVFLIGHSINNFLLAWDTKNAALNSLVEYVLWIFPNLEFFNWRVAALYQDPVYYDDIVWNVLYAALWVLILLIPASQIFERKPVG